MQAGLAQSLPDLALCDDTVLVERARRNDAAAVRAIVQRHNRRLFRVARAVLHDDAEAEDVVQETYCRALTNLAGFRGDSGLATWLTRIALNEALGRRRRQRSRQTRTAEMAAESREGARLIMFPASPQHDSPETELARRQIRRQIEGIVDALPEPFRIVFVLRAIEEMDTDEVARQLDIKPATVKTRLHRARRLIRDGLERQATAAFSDLFPFDGARCVHMADRVIAALRQRGQLT